MHNMLIFCCGFFTIFYEYLQHIEGLIIRSEIGCDECADLSCLRVDLICEIMEFLIFLW